MSNKHTNSMSSGDDEVLDQDSSEYITVIIEGQLFGIPVLAVHDVFVPRAVTRVPMSNPEVGGVLNLRGRIVTVIDMRERLELPARADGGASMAVGVEYRGESYGLVIDSVGEVLRVKNSEMQSNPSTLDRRWRSVSVGVQRLENDLMVVLDVPRVLDFSTKSVAA